MPETLKSNEYTETFPVLRNVCWTCRDGTCAGDSNDMWCERIGATDDSDDVKPWGWCKKWEKEV